LDSEVNSIFEYKNLDRLDILFGSPIKLEGFITMPCKCKDTNGSPLEKCNGLCMDRINQINVEEQKRAQEDGFTDKMFKQLDGLIRHHSALVIQSIELNEFYTKGFKDGFKTGLEEGSNNSNY
jgi:hypothetical protein